MPGLHLPPRNFFVAHIYLIFTPYSFNVNVPSIPFTSSFPFPSHLLWTDKHIKADFMFSRFTRDFLWLTWHDVAEWVKWIDSENAYPRSLPHNVRVHSCIHDLTRSGTHQLVLMSTRVPHHLCRYVCSYIRLSVYLREDKLYYEGNFKNVAIFLWNCTY